MVSLGSDLLVLLNADSQIMAANGRFAELFGEDANDAIGKSFAGLVHDADRLLLPESIHDFEKRRQELRGRWEMRIKLPDGRYQLVSCMPTNLSGDPRFKGLLLSLRPVDEPGPMIANRQMLMEAIEAANNCIVVADATDEDLPLIYINAGFRKVTGYGDEVLGHNCRFLQDVAPEDNKGVDTPDQDDQDLSDLPRGLDDVDHDDSLNQIRQAIKNREFIDTTIRNYRKDGTAFYNHLYLTPVSILGHHLGFIGVQNDVTDQLRAKRELRDREQLLTGFLDAAPMMMGVLSIKQNRNDVKGELPQAEAEAFEHSPLNSAARGYFGPAAKSTGNGQGRQLSSFALTSESIERWRQALVQTHQSQQPETFVVESNSDPDVTRLRVTVSEIDDEISRGRRTFCYIASDLAELRAAEDERDLLYAAVDNSGESLLVTRRDGTVTYANPAFKETFGFQVDDARGQPVGQLLDNADQPFLQQLFGDDANAAIAHWPARGETTAIDADGRTRYVEWVVNRITEGIDVLNGSRDKAGYVIGLRDLTARRQLERQVLDIQENERERIARDLHDTVAQQLNTLTLLVGNVRRELKNDGISPDQVEQLDEAVHQAQLAAEQARSISHTLGAVELTRAGLIVALRQHADRVKRAYGVDIALEADDAVQPRDGEADVHLFRITSEAINNAVRHGQPSRVDITICRHEAERGQGLLIVADNGRGIPDEARGVFGPRGLADRQPNVGLGLNSMAYRAGLIAGQLKIEPGNGGQGTVVTCQFPIKPG